MMTQENIPTPEQTNFRSVSAEDFVKLRDMLEPDLFAFLTPHTKTDYEMKGTRLFLSEDTRSGFGVNPDGELTSIFSLERKRGKILVAEARRQGAKYLSCMGDHLLQLYSEFDFSPVIIMKWDKQFAPRHWNYERFGTPNIYDMELINPYADKFDSGHQSA